VTASSVNQTDVGTANGVSASFGMPHEHPVAPGRDFAGTVEAIGHGVMSLGVGDEVFGEVPLTPPLHNGSWPTSS